MESGYYSIEELKEMKFQSCGTDVQISRKASIYGAKNMSIGNHVRIDDFCMLVGKITIGNYIHITPYCSLHGGDFGITMEDFSALGSKGCIYAASDDYSGSVMTNSTIPKEYISIGGAPIIIGKHAVVGIGCVLLPGAMVAEGSSIGAMSLIIKPTEPWSINVGIPCKKIKDRKKDLLLLEKKFMATQKMEKNGG